MATPRLLLASASPRRRELLVQLGLEFDVLAAQLDETPRPTETPAQYVERLAQEKASAVLAHKPEAVVLAADTSVVVDGGILGKPGTSTELGASMLKRLAGRTHEVMTGVAVARGLTMKSVVVVTAVEFRPLRDFEIDWYVSTREGQDKAGGYALQGRAGAFITRLNGSSSNVIGLPLAETVALLSSVDYRLPWETR